MLGVHPATGRSAEANEGLRSPTDAASAEGAVGQRPPVPDADAEAASGAHGVDSPSAERQPGDRSPEPSGGAGAPPGGSGGGAQTEGSGTGAEEVLRKAAAAAQEGGAETATMAAGGPGGLVILSYTASAIGSLKLVMVLISRLNRCQGGNRKTTMSGPAVALAEQVMTWPCERLQASLPATATSRRRS